MSFNEWLTEIYYKFKEQGSEAPVHLGTIKQYLALEGISVD